MKTFFACLLAALMLHAHRAQAESCSEHQNKGLRQQAEARSRQQEALKHAANSRQHSSLSVLYQSRDREREAAREKALARAEFDLQMQLQDSANAAQRAAAKEFESFAKCTSGATPKNSVALSSR